MKSIYRCTNSNCGKYTLHKSNCKYCDAKVQHPYPARFSLVKERKFRRLYN